LDKDISIINDALGDLFFGKEDIIVINIKRITEFRNQLKEV